MDCLHPVIWDHQAHINEWMTFEHLAHEFENDILPGLHGHWEMILPLLGISCPLGNLGTITATSLWLNLLGLPGPRLGTYQLTPNSNPLVPFLRSNPEYYLRCEDAYLRGFLAFLKAKIASNYNPPAVNQTEWQAARSMISLPSQDGLLFWNKQPFRPISIGELLILTDDTKTARPKNLKPGDRGFGVSFADPTKRPVFCREICTIQAGPNKGLLALRQCYRTGKSTICAAYGIDNLHPFAQWLSGLELLADQDVAPDAVSYRDATAGDWALWATHHPLRQAIIEAMQERYHG